MKSTIPGSTKRVAFDDAIVDPNPLVDNLGNPVLDNLNKPVHKLKYHETKLTEAAPWTSNQSSEVIEAFADPAKVKTDTYGNEFLEFEIRSSNFILNEQVPGTILKQGRTIRLYKTDVYKSFGNGQENGIPITNNVF